MDTGFVLLTIFFFSFVYDPFVTLYLLRGPFSSTLSLLLPIVILVRIIYTTMMCSSLSDPIWCLQSTELAESGPHTLNPNIRLNLLRDFPVTYDLRLDISHVQFRDLKRPVSTHDLMQFATEPPLPFMRLSHPRIPWYIDVVPRDAVGVTLWDLFNTMHGYLFERIKRSDFWNTEMGEEDRDKITRSWRERVGRSREEMAQGVLKVRFVLRPSQFRVFRPGSLTIPRRSTSSDATVSS